MAVEPGMVGLAGLGINTAAAALVKGVTPKRALPVVKPAVEGTMANNELVAPKASKPWVLSL